MIAKYRKEPCKIYAYFHAINAIIDWKIPLFVEIPWQWAVDCALSVVLDFNTTFEKKFVKDSRSSIQPKDLRNQLGAVVKHCVLSFLCEGMVPQVLWVYSTWTLSRKQLSLKMCDAIYSTHICTEQWYKARSSTIVHRRLPLSDYLQSDLGQLASFFFCCANLVWVRES